MILRPNYHFIAIEFGQEIQSFRVLTFKIKVFRPAMLLRTTLAGLNPTFWRWDVVQAYDELFEPGRIKG